ncbi:hypothetical protein FORC066_3797 [Yersinia enterocolitica]|nr:hypothetical protein FORC066_3797 [Yersinia enterocolitica]
MCSVLQLDQERQTGLMARQDSPLPSPTEDAARNNVCQIVANDLEYRSRV